MLAPTKQQLDLFKAELASLGAIDSVGLKMLWDSYGKEIEKVPVAEVLKLSEIET